tara:strand:- start:288 stop:578 length:291 start_codon:yes stop_codon:yes gene_type:complete
MKAPKLTKMQLKSLNIMKLQVDVHKHDYAYVEVDNRGLKLHKVRPVQALIDKGLVRLEDGKGREVTTVLNFKAYIGYLTPIAYEYPYVYPFEERFL